jgi:polyferredoxin
MRPDASWRFELTRFPLVRSILGWRPLQFALILVTLAVFVLALLTAFLGTPAGNRNFSIIFVWVVWWALLMIVLVPALGRGWCAACPIPAPGEWLQRQSFVHPRRRRLRTLGLRWPGPLRNIWLQNAGFLALALVSAVILTRPAVTGIVLLAFVLVAVALSLVYERRTFCRYVCPVGGFIGLYSMAAPVEVRVKDVDVCRTHDTKDCYLGNEHGFGCPWLVFPGSLTRNTHCGLCLECLKSCTMGNVVVNLRAPGADLVPAGGRRLDEAYKAFIMLACALAYSVVLLGPWGTVKDAANFARLDWWLLYAGGLLALNLLVVPALFVAAAALSRGLAGLGHLSLRSVTIDQAYALVPLGLAAWVAFSLGLVLVNARYALPVVADPFGWGWNLFGLRDVPWAPVFPLLLPQLQVLALLAGLGLSLHTAWRIATERSPDRTLRAVLPGGAVLSGVTLAFLWLYLG